MKTPFEKFVESVNNGTQSTPVVNGGKISYIQYQLACHKRDIALWQKGIKINRHFKITDYKRYYGLTGNDRGKLLEQFMVIFNKYTNKNNEQIS